MIDAVQQFVVNEPTLGVEPRINQLLKLPPGIDTPRGSEGKFGKAGLDALDDDFYDLFNCRPFDLRKVLRAIYVKQDRLEQRINNNTEFLQKSMIDRLGSNGTVALLGAPISRVSTAGGKLQNKHEASTIFAAKAAQEVQKRQSQQPMEGKSSTSVKASAQRQSKEGILKSGDNMDAMGRILSTKKPHGENQGVQFQGKNFAQQLFKPEGEEPDQHDKGKFGKLWHRMSHAIHEQTGGRLSKGTLDNDSSGNNYARQSQGLLPESLQKDQKMLMELQKNNDKKNKIGQIMSSDPTLGSECTKSMVSFKTGSFRKRVRAIVLHTAFDGVISFVIIANSVFIGLSLELNIQHGKEPDWLTASSYCCNFIFLCELIIRLTAFGIRYFTSEDWAWNLFDFVLVILSMVDLIFDASSGSSELSSQATKAQGMKTLKMVRIIRIFRVFRFFKELSLLASMIADSVKSLMWALLMLGIILYVFSILFTQACSDWLAGHSGEKTDLTKSVENQFGTLPKTIYNLVLSMLAGNSWGDVVETLMKVDIISTCLFFFYILFCLLAVLNIVNGVFVENAVETARSQRDALANKERHLREKYITEMYDFFMAMDEDRSGTVTLEEMLQYFSDTAIRDLFRALGLEPSDMPKLFRLLDVDNSGEIQVDEFLEGCLRLKGDAKSIDVHTVLAICRSISHRLDLLIPRPEKPGS